MDDENGTYYKLKNNTYTKTAPTTENEMIRYWELKGCWIQSIQEQPMDSNQNGARTITANIIFDRAIPHMPDEELMILQ